MASRHFRWIKGDKGFVDSLNKYNGVQKMRLKQRLARLEARKTPEVERPTIDASKLSGDLVKRIIENRSDLSVLSEAERAEIEAARIDYSLDSAK